MLDNKEKFRRLWKFISLTSLLGEIIDTRYNLLLRKSFINQFRTFIKQTRDLSISFEHLSIKLISMASLLGEIYAL